MSFTTMNSSRDLAQKMAEKSDQELRAMFASPQDWTAEALESAKVELRTRGLDSPGERPPLEPEFPEPGGERPDIYEYFGTYSNSDARLLLDAFVKEGIAYTLNVDTMGIQNQSALYAANGGPFGRGAGIAIGVHVDDCDEAMTIRDRVLKIIP